MAETCIICCQAVTGRVATRYDQRPVCSLCYAKDFCSVKCNACGRPTKSYQGAIPALCSYCRERSLCKACGKRPVSAISRITPAGRICSRCAEKADPPKTCSTCGRTSRHVFNIRGTAGQTTCRDCKHPGLYSVCDSCGKHRKVALRDEAGRARCQHCARGPFICPNCGTEGRRHSASMCYACYLRQRATSSAASAAISIENVEYRTLYRLFTQDWIGATTPNQHRSAALKRHARLFIQLSAIAPKPENIESDLFFQAFTPLQVHRAYVSISWMRKKGYLGFLTVDSLTEESARVSQEALLERTPTGWKRELLTRYLAHLRSFQGSWQRRGWTGEHQRFISRTITSALSAAHFFVESGQDAAISPQSFDQEMLDRFLNHRPGRRNGLRRFVEFLNRKEKLFRPLSIPSAQPPFAAHLLLPSSRASSLIDRWTTSLESEDRNALLLLFMLVYARTATQACKLKRGTFSIGNNGVVTAKFGRVPIELDDETARIVRRYLERLEADRGRLLLMEDYIFPGRIDGHHYKRTSLNYVMGLQDLAAPQLFATGLAEAYRAGLKIPKVLVRSLGISDQSALTYGEAFAPRVAEELAQRTGRR